MYILVALVAMLGYAAQSTLVAQYYRRFDPWSVTAARGLSLGITMLPLLLLAEPSSLTKIFNFPLLLLAASICAAFGNWCAGKALYYLPVGIASAFQQGLLVIGTACIGYFFFQESLSRMQTLAIIFILLGNAIAVLRNEGLRPALDKEAAAGLIYSSLFGLSLGAAFSLVTELSRKVDPFVTAYTWEFTIGIISSILVLCRNRMFKSDRERITFRTFTAILLCSAPTAIGTGGYAVAVTLGPLALVTAIVSTLSIAASVFSYFLYAESLSRQQIAAIAIILGAILLIKLNQG